MSSPRSLKKKSCLISVSQTFSYSIQMLMYYEIDYTAFRWKRARVPSRLHCEQMRITPSCVVHGNFTVLPRHTTNFPHHVDPATTKTGTRDEH